MAAEQLFLRLHGDADTCSWVVVDGDGRLVQGQRSGMLGDIGAATAGRRVVLLVPGPEIVTTKAALPAASQGRLRQMLPYSLEDTFAEDVDELAFAIGPKLASGAYQVSVVARHKLEAWLARLAAAGLAVQAVYADSDGVPNTPSTLTVIVEGDTVYGRRPGEHALALEGLTLEQVFSVLTAARDNEANVQHAIVYLDAAAKARHEAELAVIASSLASLDVKLMHDGPLAAFAAKLTHEPGTNLLQGRYAPKSDWNRMLEPWRFAAMILAALIGATLIANVADYFRLRRHDAVLTETVVSQCRDQMSTDRLSQCQNELAALGRSSGAGDLGGESFLSMLGAIAESATAANRFESMSYRNRVLNVQLTAPDVSALSELERKIDGTGRFDMTIQATNPLGDGGIEARVQVIGNAP